jgi:hypothetical protein
LSLAKVVKGANPQRYKEKAPEMLLHAVILLIIKRTNPPRGELIIKFKMQSKTSAIKSSKLEMIYGKETADRVQTSKILVIGAGGIGCELMKCLSVTGFTQITLVSL